MLLSDCLLHRDYSDLKEMAISYQCQCNLNSKMELVQALYLHLTSRSPTTEAYDQEDVGVLRLATFLYFMPDSHYGLDDLRAKAALLDTIQSLPLSTGKTIGQLIKNGWLYPKEEGAIKQYMIPTDLKKIMKQRLLQYWLKQHDIESIASLQATSLSTAEHHLIADLVLFLTQLDKKPLPLTREGTLHKRELEKLLFSFSIKEEIPYQEKWRFGYGRRFPAYPNRFALLYDFCFYKRWIEELNGYLRLSLEAELLVKEQEESFNAHSLQQELYRYWLLTYGKPIPTLSFIVNMLKEIEGWISLENIMQLSKRWLKPFYYDDEERIFKERIVKMLYYLGRVNLQQISEQEAFTRVAFKF